MVARYGVEDGGRSGSSSWREIVRIRDGVGDGEGRFASCVRRRVGDGANTNFWHDCWCGVVPFREHFRRLYDLAVNKTITARNMFLLGWEEGGEAWQWGSRLWAWEDELVEECMKLLLNVSLQDTSNDMWQWLLDPNEGYSVRGVYNMLTSHEHPQLHQNMEFIWHKQVPLIVYIFVWWMFKERLPIKSNLAICGIIPSEVRMCVHGCGHVEDTTHLFLSCPTFGAIWSLVRAWLGFDGADSQVISDHLLQFIHYASGLKSRRSLFHLIWLLCVWVLWNEQNNRLFKDQQCSIPHLLEKVKSYSLWWLKASKATFVFGTHLWWLSPLMCLGIG